MCSKPQQGRNEVSFGDSLVLVVKCRWALFPAHEKSAVIEAHHRIASQKSKKCWFQASQQLRSKSMEWDSMKSMEVILGLSHSLHN